MKYDHQNFIVGGCNPKTQECYNDVHILDTITLHWSIVTIFGEEVLQPLEYGASQFLG